MERAQGEARKALELDETLAEAHTSLAWVTFIYDWDWAAADREFRRAHRAQPALLGGAAVAFLVPDRDGAARRRASRRARRAIELDPASVSIRRSMGWLYYYARQPEGSLEHLRRALAMDPTAEENHRLLGLAYLQLGQYDEAAAAFRESIALSQSPALATAGLGAVAAARGPARRSAEVLGAISPRSRQRGTSHRWRTSRCMRRSARRTRRFAWIDKAYEERRGWLCYLKVEPLLDSLRGDPRFARTMERMRLV